MYDIGSFTPVFIGPSSADRNILDKQLGNQPAQDEGGAKRHEHTDKVCFVAALCNDP